MLYTCSQHLTFTNMLSKLFGISYKKSRTDFTRFYQNNYLNPNENKLNLSTILKKKIPTDDYLCPCQVTRENSPTKIFKSYLLEKLNVKHYRKSAKIGTKFSVF